MTVTITYNTSGSILAWIWVTFVDFRSTVSSSVSRITCTVIPLPCIMILQGKEVKSHDNHMTVTWFSSIVPHSVHAHCREKRHKRPIAFHSSCQWSQFYSCSQKCPFRWYMCLHCDRDWSDTGSDLSHSHCPERIKKNYRIIPGNTQNNLFPHAHLLLIMHAIKWILALKLVVMTKLNILISLRLARWIARFSYLCLPWIQHHTGNGSRQQDLHMSLH